MEEKPVEEVIRIVCKYDEKYFGKEGKILGTAFCFRCILCSFRVFLDAFSLVLRLVLQVSVEVVLKPFSQKC